VGKSTFIIKKLFVWMINLHSVHSIVLPGFMCKDKIACASSQMAR